MSNQNKLSAQEQYDRTRLEKLACDLIAEGLRNLAEIEEIGLWRETYQTFDAYCFDRFGFRRSQLITEVSVSNLEE